MATDLDRALCGWPHEELMIQEDSEDASLPQGLDHGSISFGRYAVESLAWEKRSAFTHDRRHEELEKLKAPGLVAKKKAYFEEYYKRLRAMKSLQAGNETEPMLEIVQEEGTSQSNHSLEEEFQKDGAEAEVSAHLGHLTVLDEETEIGVNEQIEAKSSELKPSKAEHPSIDEDGISASEKLEKLSSSVIVESSSSSHQIEKVECREKSDFLMESACNGNAASRTTTRMIKYSSHSKEKKNGLSLMKDVKVSSEAPSRKSAFFCTMQRRPATSNGVGDSLRPFSTKKGSVNMNAADSDKKCSHGGISQVTSTSNGQIPLTGARGRLMQKAEPRYLPAVRKCKNGSEVNGDGGTRKSVLHRGASKPVAPPIATAGTSNRPRKQLSSRHSDRQDGKKPRQELKPWR